MPKILSAYDTPATRYGHAYDKPAQDLEEAVANVAYYEGLLALAIERFREAVGTIIAVDGDADRAVDIATAASGGLDMGAYL